MLPCRLLLIFSSGLFAVATGQSQPLSIVFKKDRTVLERYWPGSVLAFQLETGAWEKGQVMEIRPDSFYLRPYTIKFTMTGPDTTFFPIDGYALTNIYALPKPGFQIEYFDGAWNVLRSGGHVHWYWIKSGWIFRVAGVGYIGLQTLNGLIRKDFSLKQNATGFSIAGAAALAGVVLKKTYRISRRVGKKYRLSIY